ncbi:MAG: hypothetical protein F9K29_07515 [Hyphomicrobiaceae bacterium]|nr:MAG: hypothetical protein F9K29_07515 [Hyphomicrobiaceae bacterium]
MLLLLIFAAVEMDGRTPATPYGVFLDQLAAGNVASVTFQGTDIRGRFKQPVGETTSSGAVQGDVFRSRVPDFGDPNLIPELRKQRVVIDVTAPSPWTWLLGRVPWPMLAIVAVMLVAALTRMLRGPAVPGPAGPAMPAHGMGMIGLLSGLFAGQRAAEQAPKGDGEAPKSR